VPVPDLQSGFSDDSDDDCDDDDEDKDECSGGEGQPTPDFASNSGGDGDDSDDDCDDKEDECGSGGEGQPIRRTPPRTEWRDDDSTTTVTTMMRTTDDRGTATSTPEAAATAGHDDDWTARRWTRRRRSAGIPPTRPALPGDVDCDGSVTRDAMVTPSVAGIASSAAGNSGAWTAIRHRRADALTILPRHSEVHRAGRCKLPAVDNALIAAW
jgi:hypothetical protein